MADLGLGLDARLRVMRQAREGLAREHRVDGAFEERLSAKYRKERKALETLLWSAGEDHPYEPGLAVLRQRSEALRPVVAELSALERDGRLTESLEELAGSFVHMHVNRLLRAAHRAQELVIYDFLGRLYESRIARARRSGDEG
jgi:thiopeptide-type bacteriocin biosynthesis protein